MKRIIIALAAIAMAIGAHAATVNWIMAGVTQPETTTAANGYVAYLFASSVSDSLNGKFMTFDQADVIAAIEGGTFGSFAGNAIATGKTNSSGGILSQGIGPEGGFVASDSISLFAVIFDSSDYASATHYAATVTDKSASFTSPTGAKPASWANFSTTAGQEWVAVPEPTSGLLMLVGLAGLAFRRRRA